MSSHPESEEVEKPRADAPEAPLKLPKYVRPNVSRLEAVRSIIADARLEKWSYLAIVTLLQEEHGISICIKSLRLYCDRRGIKKGVGETQLQQTSAEANGQRTTRAPGPPAASPPKKKKAKFVFREGPMRTRSNRMLEDDTTN